MGKLMFGTDEKIECIQNVGVTGGDGEPLCLAYKTRKVFFGAGVWLHDDGYVLRNATNANSYYPWPDAAQVEKWQSMQLLPVPLPTYSIPWYEYAFGYSLWLIVLALGAWAMFRGWLTKRRHAANALVPVSMGPPKQDTEYDRLISDEAKKHLGDGELLQHQAWAVNEGVADPKRVCIYGASYGGYATLAGLTQTPDLYACGVDYVGVANLFTFLKTIPPYWKPYLEMTYEMVGHPERDKERMTAASPALNADRIKAPLLIAQGARDPRVKKDESDQMVAALIALALSLLLIVAGFWRPEQDGGPLYQLVYFFSVPLHFDRAFTRGVIDTRPLLLYASTALFCLFLTVRSLEAKRWR